MLPGLAEASGLAASRRHSGLLWSHNDSGSPVIFAVSTDGSIKGRVVVAGARVDDWEDIAVGPCPQGSCLYVADIGDNNASRQRITIYRVTEPASDDKTSPAADAFHATYPDGPRDAEALFVTSANDLFVVTKDEPVSLYRFPRALRSDSTVQLQRLATFGETLGKERVTGAAASPDGRWVVVRTQRSVVFFRAPALVGGNVRDALRFDVSPLKEPRGEGVALTADGTVYLAGEGAGRREGTLARIMCTLPG